jgi:uncharacterized membrane protein YedE/YeeE
MVATGVAMLRGCGEPGCDDEKAEGASGEAKPVPRSSGRITHVVLHGLVVGAVTGLVGAGGGFLIVPSLVLLGRMRMKEAVATSLLVIGMKSTAGFAGYAGHVPVDTRVVLPIVAVAVVGSVLGSLVSRKVPARMLKKGFAGFVLVMAVFVVARALPESVRAAAAFQAVFVERWPAWVGGLGVASVVLLMLFLTNRQVGVSTGCAELCSLHRDPALRSSWRPRFLVGIVLGGVVAALFSGASPTLAMGALDGLVGGSEALKLAVLAGGGVLIGFGARLAGGCTSGHGIVGTALGAKSSLVATALFMAGGFAVTNLLLGGQ